MTDKMIDNRNGMELEPLNATDDQLLQAFFADNRMEEIPDDGFSDRVMQALPGLEQKKTVLSLEQKQALAKRRRLEHLWTAACCIAVWLRRISRIAASVPLPIATSSSRQESWA